MRKHSYDGGGTCGVSRHSMGQAEHLILHNMTNMTLSVCFENVEFFFSVCYFEFGFASYLFCSGALTQ